MHCRQGMRKAGPCQLMHGRTLEQRLLDGEGQSIRRRAPGPQQVGQQGACERYTHGVAACGFHQKLPQLLRHRGHGSHTSRACAGTAVLITVPSGPHLPTPL